MQRIRWCRWLAVGALVAPSAGRAQAPRPKIREIATIPGVDVWDLVRLPNGRVVLYTVGDSVVAYDLTTKRKTLVTRDWFDVIRLSPAGDRIAYGHRGEDGRGEWIWSMPIDPSTGAAAGPAQRVTTIQGDYPSFSPDGKLIAFNTNPTGGRRLGPLGGCRHRRLRAHHCEVRIGNEVDVVERRWEVDLCGSQARHVTFDRASPGSGRSKRNAHFVHTPWSYTRWMDRRTTLLLPAGLPLARGRPTCLRHCRGHARRVHDSAGHSVQ